MELYGRYTYSKVRIPSSIKVLAFLRVFSKVQIYYQRLSPRSIELFVIGECEVHTSYHTPSEVKMFLAIDG